MKSLFCLLLFSLAVAHSDAQTTAPPTQRRIQFHSIGKDSINLSLNEDYDMIEDSCAQIIRQGHLNFSNRKFMGKFKDVSKLDPSMVLSEGTYTADGTKDGLFISHFSNGNLRSKGVYKNGNYDGKWEVYFDNGKPSMEFEAVNDTVKIMNVWGADGKKVIDNGKGTYHANLGTLTWKGKLDNGKPDGTWHGYKTDDATQTSLIDESFKKGVFQGGSGPMGKYTNASRMILVDPNLFPFDRAEKLHVSAVPCNGTKRMHIVNAQYENGTASFSEFIKMAVSSYISKYDIKQYNDQLILEGEIAEDGRIVGLQSKSISFNESFTRGLINAFHNVPALHPATADGKPIREKFSITFTFNLGVYYYSYRFLGIDQNSIKK